MSRRAVATAGAAVTLLLAVASTPAAGAVPARSSGPDLDRYRWTEVQPDAPWEARAGLQTVDLRGRFYLMGGRTPVASTVPGASVIHGDVWESRDRGVSWKRLVRTGAPGMWSPRAYFQALRQGPAMYVIGGQDTAVVPNPGCASLPPGVPCDPPEVLASTFFNDVWRTANGRDWTRMTAAAGWDGRAGLSAVSHRGALYVFGGSRNDDSSIVGPGGPARVYYNDVWRSTDDGRTWTRLTEHAPWAPRAGAAAVVKDGYIWLLGGEDGFVCNPSTPRCPPYFNDVWRSRDGVGWERVTPAAAWSPRPGHQCVVVRSDIVCFGGFGLSADPADPFAPANPTDMWSSRNGRDWSLVDRVPWNAAGPSDIKYDFDAIVVPFDRGLRPAIYTFGGDRETFNFFDPFNYLRVDDDVWRFAAR